MNHYVKIYHRKSHLVMTFVVIILPFLFTLISPMLPFAAKFAFLNDLLASTWRIGVAFLISVVLALIFGITLSRGKIGNFFLPVFDVMQSFPTFALLPLAVTFIGANSLTVILFLVITIIWPILFTIISSQKLIKSEWEEAATIFGAKGWRRWIHFYFPISYPALITGAIVGLGNGWEAVIGGEIVIGLKGYGLGSFFDHNAASGPIVFFGVLAFLLFIFSLNKLIWLPLLERAHKILSE